MSGFTNCIGQLLADTELVYAGYSAGAVVATPDLHGIEFVDDPVAAPDGYDKKTPWEGLGLVGFRIAPHYRSDHPESEACEKVVEYFENRKLTYTALQDGEAIVVHNKSVEVVGKPPQDIGSLLK